MTPLIVSTIRWEYEQKIGTLIRNLCTNARGNNREEFDAWTMVVACVIVAIGFRVINR